jgi:quercetin dioxygenase-like cupin family protein
MDPPRPVTAGPGVALDLAGSGRAVLWGLQTTDLNVNLVAWPPGEGVAEHVNAELDVLVVVVRGACRVRIDGQDVPLVAGQAIVIPKGSARSISADPSGVTYLTTHRRRRPLDVGSPAS